MANGPMGGFMPTPPAPIVTGKQDFASGGIARMLGE